MTKATDLKRLLWAGPLTVILSLLAVFAVRVAAFAGLDLSPDYPPLTWQGLTFFTTVLVAVAVLVYAAVIWLSATPVRTYRRIALAALVLSFIPDILLVVIPDQAVQTSWTEAIVLMVTHVAAWAPVRYFLVRSIAD